MAGWVFLVRIVERNAECSSQKLRNISLSISMRRNEVQNYFHQSCRLDCYWFLFLSNKREPACVGRAWPTNMRPPLWSHGMLQFPRDDGAYLCSRSQMTTLFVLIGCSLLGLTVWILFNQGRWAWEYGLRPMALGWVLIRLLKSGGRLQKLDDG